jgi:hypothetical protein
MVLIRRGADELLISHGAGAGFVLDVLDSSNGLALKRRLPMTDRTDYKGYTSWVQLSRDERFFAYSTQSMRTELPECKGGGDGPSCARNGVRIVDLVAGAAAEEYFELPRYCGPGSLAQFGSDGIAATCYDGTTHVFRDGLAVDVSDAVTPRRETDPVIHMNDARGMFGVTSDDGWHATLMTEGSFVWKGPGGVERNLKAVPPGKLPRWPQFVETGDGRLVVGYVTRYYDQTSEGLAVFDMARGVIERTIGVPEVVSIAAVGPTTLLALTTDAALIEVDVRTGTSLKLSALPIVSGSSTVLVR